jgi:hypothetical protein
MKLITTLLLCLLVFTMNGQIKKNGFELNTRPVSLLSGIITLGAEVQAGKDVSILFDGGAGTSAFGLSTHRTFMIGARRYFTPGSSRIRRELLKQAPFRPLEGLYITARHRSRFYSDNGFGETGYGQNTNVMIGKKAMIDEMSIAGEVGFGRQTLWGEEIVLPTFSFTVGYRLN